MKSIVLYTEQETIDLAAFIAPLLKIGDLIYLTGDLGSGKTFFAKQIGRFLGVQDEIVSPSFVLLNEYQGRSFPLYHLDLYRLKQESELLDLGIFDLLETGVTLIEWSELAEKLLPDPTLKLIFHFDGIERKVDLIPGAEFEPDLDSRLRGNDNMF